MVYKSIKITLFFIHGYTLHRRATAALLFVLFLFPPFFFNEFHVDAMIKSCCRANATFYPIREIWKIFINVGATKREKFISYSSSRRVASNNNQEMTRTGTSANKYGLGTYIFPYLPWSSGMCRNILRDENIPRYTQALSRNARWSNIVIYR